MGIVKAKDLTFEYIRRDEEGNVEGITTAVDHVNMDIQPGEFIAILGHNGSGKSTFAKHINALLFPTEGTILVDGLDTSDEDNVMDVRQRAGMVFQNPDNQIICTLVEEEVGFGPENIGVPTEEIWERVAASLKAVGMYQYRKASPNKLSGGQKQRVAIAGIVAMKPKCIILDEPTAMLDPHGRADVMDADRVFVMDEGKVVMEGTPRQIFSRVEELKQLRLDVPQVTELAYELSRSGVPIRSGILTNQELIDELMKLK